MRQNRQDRGKRSETAPTFFYRTDVINGAIGAQRLTNHDIAKRANLNPKSVAAVRNGIPNIALPTLKAVLDAIGLTLQQVFEPKPETDPATAEGSRSSSSA